jgi:hypothetical protein
MISKLAFSKNTVVHNSIASFVVTFLKKASVELMWKRINQSLKKGAPLSQARHIGRRN